MAPPHNLSGNATPSSFPVSERRLSRLRRTRGPTDDGASVALSRAKRLLDRIEGLIRLYELDSVATLLERAATLAQDDPRCRARLLFLRAKFDGIEARSDSALLSAQRSVQLWKALGELSGEALARAEITRILLAAGNSRDALDEGLAALASADASGDVAARAQVMRTLAHVYLSLEQFDQSIAFCESAAECARLSHDEVTEGAAIDTIAARTAPCPITRPRAATTNARAPCSTIRWRAPAKRCASRSASGHRHNEATALANLCEGLVLSDRAAEASMLMAAWRPEACGTCRASLRITSIRTGRICMTLRPP